MGLHRLTERFDEVEAGDELVVRTRAAAAATDRGVRVTYRWTPRDRAVALTVDVEPGGRLAGADRDARRWRSRCPATLDHVSWFGRGPGESYPDTGSRRGSAASTRRSTSCRRPTSGRRRTAGARTSAG